MQLSIKVEEAFACTKALYMHDFQHVLVRKQVYQVQVRVITTYEVLLRRLSPER